MTGVQKWQRWLRFLAARFPVMGNLVGSLALATAIHAPLQLAAGQQTWFFSMRTVAAALVAFATSLLMRSYDEIKDADVDVRLAAKGDARFATRPIVTGAITLAELFQLRSAALVVFAMASALAIWVSPDRIVSTLAMAVLFGVVWLSSRWFFWPRIQQDLLLALLTHNPIAGLVGFTLVAVLVGGEVDFVLLAALVSAAWFPLTTWETSRKLRAPQDENDFETYSRRLGFRWAALMPCVFSLCTVCCLGVISHRVGAPSWLLPATIAPMVVLWLAAGRFITTPTTRSAHLQPIAELFMLVATAALPLALMLTRPVALCWTVRGDCS